MCAKGLCYARGTKIYTIDSAFITAGNMQNNIPEAQACWNKEDNTWHYNDSSYSINDSGAVNMACNDEYGDGVSAVSFDGGECYQCELDSDNIKSPAICNDCGFTNDITLESDINICNCDAEEPLLCLHEIRNNKLAANYELGSDLVISGLNETIVINDTENYQHYALQQLLNKTCGVQYGEEYVAVCTEATKVFTQAINTNFNLDSDLAIQCVNQVTEDALLSTDESSPSCSNGGRYSLASCQCNCGVDSNLAGTDCSICINNNFADTDTEPMCSVCKDEGQNYIQRYSGKHCDECYHPNYSTESGCTECKSGFVKSYYGWRHNIVRDSRGSEISPYGVKLGKLYYTGKMAPTTHGHRSPLGTGITMPSCVDYCNNRSNCYAWVWSGNAPVSGIDSADYYFNINMGAKGDKYCWLLLDSDIREHHDVAIPSCKEGQGCDDTCENGYCDVSNKGQCVCYGNDTLPFCTDWRKKISCNNNQKWSDSEDKCVDCFTLMETYSYSPVSRIF